MKTKLTIAALSLLSVISLGASAAAHQINSEQAQGLQSMGSISVSQVGSAPMDMRQELSQKATEQGASAYRVIEARSGDNWHATAELYK
ncbi:peroxide/acid stress response protein YhcN [Enterobacter sp. Ap-916]|uniref:peroxide/acid stress response protein YhcN n=1 Tax=unclassified Enterobacter TaxID=2608935 RepID=UPI001421C095|nr:MULTISPECIES: peroxide/acid stress response protein YhcN [unclassified Enterobacter]NIF60024.1 peroxide/acid stress response protein YhcN [Enterobacter sp. Ap-867]NIG31431.1 peroxide/acid stress response protein YhcN [Enterobacter sp. Ap-916]